MGRRSESREDDGDKDSRDGSADSRADSRGDSCDSDRSREKDKKKKSRGKSKGSDEGSRSRSRSRGRRRKSKRSRSRSSSKSRDRSVSPTYSVEDLWRRLEHLGTWRGLGKQDKQRGSLSGAEKYDLRDLEDKLERRLTSGYRSSCIRTSLTILERGYWVKQEHMERMLAQCVQRPGVNQVCMTLKLLQICTPAVIGMEAFLRGLGVLIQRNAPVQLVRMWLNLGMPKASKALRELPHDYDEDEKNMAAQEMEDALGVITDDEEDEKGATRRTIFVTGCKARPELNGKYDRAEDINAFGRPVYEKIVERKVDKGKGKGKGGKGAHNSMELKALLMPHMLTESEQLQQEVLVIHYRKDKSYPSRNGWCFSRNTPSGEGLAWNARTTKGAPSGGWFVIRDKMKLPDPIRIVDESKVNEKENRNRRQEALKALKQLDANRLKGRLQTHDKSEAAAEYFGHFCMLMHLEHLEELRQIKRRNQRMPEPELQRLGWTLDGLPCTSIFGRREPKKATMIGWEDPGSEMGCLLLPPNTNFDRLKFKRGDSVTITESRQQLRRGDHVEKIGDGFIADMRPARNHEEASLVIRLRGVWPDNALGRRWRIDKGANSTLYERQLQAMLNLVTKARPRVSELLITAKVGLADSWSKQWRQGGPTEEDKKAAAEAAERAAAEEAKNPRDRPAAKLARLNPGGAEDDKLDRALKEVKTLTHLNQSQRDAVRSALRTTCTIIQGPPGTGKTHVSVQIMKMWSKTLDLSPLLATSDSNVAVDNIAMGLRAESVKAVRVGRPDKINRILEEITLECLLEKEKVELEDRKYEARYRSRSRSKSGSPDVKRGQKNKEHKEKEKSQSRSISPIVRAKGKGKGKGKGSMKADFELQMRILQDADSICTTTISSGGDFFSKFAFAGVLVDEAAQATELAAVVPLILRGSQRLVLVGDQCQLPPTVQSTEAEERGLSLSLYSRLVDGGGLTPFLLDTQYRSHPMIAEFSARTFYAGRLKSGVDAKDRKLCRGIPWPRHDCPILFVDSSGEEQEDGESKFNNGEAELVQRFVQDCFFQRELEITEVGVVTPYVAQVRVLKRLLRNIVPEGQDPDLLEIASVDNFQGREKDLIIFSAVRSNRTGTVGFLADWRRLNVMLTRARRGIIIIGNSRTLKSDEHWAKWLEFYDKVSHGRARTPSPEKKKVVVDVNETPEQKEARLKKERVEAARKLSMAIRFPGMAMAQREKERSRSRSFSPVGTMGEADKLTQVKGGRTKPRQKTPSPDRPLRVVKEVGIGRKRGVNEFAKIEPASTSASSGAAKAKAKVKAKPKLAVESDEDGSGSGFD
mmetsp:Transcript_6214/g.13380  ORF Transcript_6214/g.13380 Transcript_6214/m.13380 type:complete len:1321 (+) Transcript_6214:150-4112(+)